MAMYIVLVCMIHYIIKIIKIKKDINISKIRPILVLAMIIDLIYCRWINRKMIKMLIRNKRLIIICLLAVLLRNIWFCIKINVRI